MIKITYEPKKHRLRMQGHADFGEPGTDILCAAASMLFYTLCQSLLCSEDKLIKAPTMQTEKGSACVECCPKEEYAMMIDTMYKTVLCGFHMLSQQYPGNVVTENGEQVTGNR